MLTVVTPTNQSRYREALHEMHKLRYRALIEHDKWEGVEGRDGLECDDFDGPETYYVLYRVDSNGPIAACVRFSPTSRPTLSSTTFAHLFAPDTLPSGDDIFDVSRFVVDPQLRTRRELSITTNQICCAWVEFAMALRVRWLTAVVDFKYLQVALANGMIMEPLGLPQEAGPHRIIGIQIPIDDRNIAAVRSWRGISGAVLSADQVTEIQKARGFGPEQSQDQGKGYAHA